MLGVSIRAPKLSTCAKPTSSSRKITTFGAPSGGRVGSGHHSSLSS
jgi:hypothetical protein